MTTRTRRLIAAAGFAAAVAACGRTELETRTFEVRYLYPSEAEMLVRPYVFTDREGAPGTLSASSGAITVRETPDNLSRIERMLAQFDRPKPMVMLHFQVIRADGAAAPEPAIAEVERELRRLFRFEGYELLAETRVGAMENAMIRQIARGGGEEFLIVGGINEVRRGEPTTVTLEIQLTTGEMAGRPVLETRVTVPVGHSVVLGTAETQTSGALILVVRAEVAGSAPPPADSAASSPATPG